MKQKEILNALRVALKTKDIDTFAKSLSNKDYADMAISLKAFGYDEIGEIFMLLPATNRTLLYPQLSRIQRMEIHDFLTQPVLISLLQTLPIDDRAELYNMVTEDIQDEVIKTLSADVAKTLVEIASYTRGTAASEATSDFISIDASKTAAESLDYIRQIADQKETIYIVYIVDNKDKLLGTVSLRELFVADPNTNVTDLIKEEPITVPANWPAKKAAELIRHYNILAVPVVDSAKRIIGIVTVDDAMDIEKESDAGSMASFGGTASLGGPDLDFFETSYKRIVGIRLFWLAVLVAFGAFTSTFVAGQEEILSEVIILAAFIAPIIDMGGNTGSQAATLIIRSMALGQVSVTWHDFWRIFRRELSIVLVIGIVIGILEVSTAIVTKNVSYEVMMTVGLSMFTCTALGGLIGSTLPFLARKIGTDPATLSSPLITSIMDLLGVMVYFGFAYIFLADVLAEAASNL